jgi:prenyltransferase beta subunit
MPEKYFTIKEAFSAYSCQMLWRKFHNACVITDLTVKWHVRFKYLRTTLRNQNSIQEETKEQIEVMECVLSSGAGSFVV